MDFSVSAFLSALWRAGGSKKRRRMKRLLGMNDGEPKGSAREQVGDESLLFLEFVFCGDDLGA